MSFDDDAGPLWKRIFFNEFVLAAILIAGILAAAFYLATNRTESDEQGTYDR